MRYMILLWVLTLVSCKTPNSLTLTTKNVENLLKQHTYLVYHKSVEGELVGAGFFFEQNKKLYFITANHIATTPVDSVKILIDNLINSTITISITDGHGKDLKTNFGEYDLYIKEVNKDIIKKVNLINKFMPNFKYFDFSKVKNIIYFGFLVTTNEKYDLVTTFPALVKSEDTIIGSYNYYRFSQSFNKYDSVNYMTKSINGTYSGEGDSGAPVFFNVKNKYYFGGMCTAGSGTLKVAYMLRPDKLIDSLKKFSK
jgi:hypothetical protein